MTVIIFDLWNTLARKNASFSAALRKHFSLELTGKAYARYEQSMMRDAYDTMEDMAASFLIEFGLETSKRNIEFIVQAEQQVLVLAAPIDGVRRLVQKLHEQHTTIILSNATCFSKELLHKWGFSEHLDRAFWSWKTGLLKPDTAAFLHVCETLRVKPSECVFIDDNLENCRAAKKTGMNAIVFESPGQLEAALREQKLLS